MFLGKTMVLRRSFLVAIALAACGGGDPAGSPTTRADAATSVPPIATTVTTFQESTTTSLVWNVGATPLPLRPDGFGEVLSTPEALVNRSLRTTDVLPPPASGGYESSISAITDEIRSRMGETIVDGCPVATSELRYLTMAFIGFDGEVHTGEMIVHEVVAEDVVTVFGELFEARFPLEEMRLITTADLRAPATGDGNNTASFVCRTVRGGTRFSAHASGLAIDINPFNNPYTSGDLVLPELASAYVERGNVRPGRLFADDVVVEAFASIGWTWGGEWQDPVDRQHFSATGG
jgi:hypothetical protein